MDVGFNALNALSFEDVDFANFDPVDMPEPPEQKLSMIPIFGFEMYAPPLIPEFDVMSGEEIIGFMERIKGDGIASGDYVNCARKLIQITVWFADHFDLLDSNNRIYENQLIKNGMDELAQALYVMDIDKIKKVILKSVFVKGYQLYKYVRKNPDSEQFGLNHLPFRSKLQQTPGEIEWRYRNQYYIKSALGFIRNMYISKDLFFYLNNTNDRYGNRILTNIDCLRLHLFLKFLAPFFGVDPDKQPIGGMYGTIENFAKSAEKSFQIGGFRPTASFSCPLIFNADGSTNFYDGIQRQFNPDYKREKAPKVQQLPSWTYKPWNELTALQKKHVRESYLNPAGTNFKVNDPGWSRLQFDSNAYLKRNYALPQFKAFKMKQWQYLLKNPELMDGLHAAGGEQVCPLIFVRQARHHVWVHCYTAQMKNGIILDMTQDEFPNAQAVFGRELNGEVSAEDLKLLMDKIKNESIKCTVLTESVVMSPTKMTTSSSEEGKVTVASKKKIKKKRKLKPVDEPETGAAQAGGGRSVSEKTQDATYSVTQELLHEAFEFNTGDFFLDSALEELAKAQSALSVLQLRLGAEFSGSTWPESELKVKLGNLPLEREEDKPILFHKLKPYQNNAINHCRHLQKHGLSGLLAADAGLGKTLVCLNMFFQDIAYNPHNDKPILVLCPKTLIHQWEKAFWKEFDEAKQFIEQKIREIPQQTWMKNLEKPEWKFEIKSVQNQMAIQNHLNQLNTNFYPNLLRLLYLLGYSCGQEGRDALMKLLKGFPHDIRLVFLASVSGNLVSVAENSKDLEHVLNRKPKVVISTISALVKLNEAEKKSFSWVVIDEADRAVTGKRERRLGEILDSWKNPQKRLLVTATPVRNSISDVWRLLELVNGNDIKGQKFFNDLLTIKEEFMRQLLAVANGKEVDIEETVSLVSRLHQRVRYLRENIHPLTFTARRNDPEIRNQWNGMIPEVSRRTMDIQLNAKQQHLLNTTLKVNDIFALYDNELKVKQHPDLIESGTSKLVEPNSIAFNQLVHQARNNPVQVIEGSPMWKEMMQDLQVRVQQNQKCLIVCRHIVPQMILKEVIGSYFARYNILVDCINGNMDAYTQGSALERHKSENQRPAVLIVINKSGAAGLDCPQDKVMYVLGEEWNDGSREQIESRHVRVGVGGEKEIIYYHAGLQHEKHMRDTSMKKKLWGDLILSHPPSRETFLEDIETMLKASVVELCAPVKNGKQLDDVQRGRLEAFSVALLEKVRDYEKEIFDAYEKCRPKEAAARPSSPKKVKVIQAHPYCIEGKDNVRYIEIPVRDTKENAWRYAYMAFMNIDRMKIECADFIRANKEERAVSNEALQARLKRHEKEKFDSHRYRIVLYYPDGTSEVFLEKPGAWTVRLLALPDGTFSPLVKM